jgi:hypothetical protein
MGAMSTRANAEDEAALARYAGELAAAIDAALAGWVRRCVERFVPVVGAVRDEVDAAEEELRPIGAAVRALLSADLDEQRSTPLAIVRGAVAVPTRILRAHGVVPVERDEFEVRSFPDDVYRLTPATFADIDPALAEPGLRWGAAKAFVFKARRRAEGRP